MRALRHRDAGALTGRALDADALNVRADGAQALDAADELAPLRREFHRPRDGRRELVYLCGHSLGLMPRRARTEVLTELDRWARRGVEGHFDGPEGWFDYHERFAAPLADLVGAQPDEVVAMNSLTVNLHLMLVSFFAPDRERYGILMESGAFPSDRYAVASQLRYHGLDPAEALIELEPAGEPARLTAEQLEARLEAESGRVALVLLPGVQHLTGQMLDIGALTRVAHAHGCRIGFDLAHAVGNVPLALDRDGPDFAVWCSYKYLNGGPGAIAGCFVNERFDDARGLARLAGWWGHDESRRFANDAWFIPIRGARGWQLSNPPIFSMAPLWASLELFRRAGGMDALRAKAERLTAYLEHLLTESVGGGLEILTPSAPGERGCQLSVRVPARHGTAAELAAALREAGVVVDARAPDVLRLTPVPLYNSFRDVYRACRALRRVLAR